MEQQIIPADKLLPQKLLILPIIDRPLFPGIVSPVIVTGEQDINTVQQSLEDTGYIGLVLTKDEERKKITSDDIYTTGTVAKILKKINLPDGGINIFVSTVKRFSIKKFLHTSEPIIAVVDYPEEINNQGDEIIALTRALMSDMKQIVENNPMISEEVRLNMVNIDQPGRIADFIAAILNIKREEQQEVLSELDIRKRMEKVLIFVKREQELLKIQKRIQQQINQKIEKSQREYFLKEQLKAIKEELGMPADAKSAEYQKLKDKIDKLPLPDDVREQVEQELEKFSLMEPNSSEFTVTRNYLETIVSLPWHEPKEENIDIKRAKRILDKDHYGLEDVKTRILEFLAVRKLKKETRGSIICLVGPPGVGKTSIGKSIARALGREFFRFSVGGMRDEAEIKGHRRTYVGAMPGKIIQGLKIVKTKNPVFMIDEIDKIGASYQGDPASALLEVLDPEQNINFRDHYLDLPFDISQVFFIATANTLDTIPRPLLDRMEIIRLSGYIEDEKIEIARKYIIPRSLEQNGLDKDTVRYTKQALRQIIRGYAREAGVRNLEKAINKIHRRIAKSLVMEELTKEELPINIVPETVEKYLDKPVFPEEETARIRQPGMAMGLAWTPYGGDTLVIEAVATPGREGLSLTGQLGDVMRESANIAYTYVKSIAHKHNIEPDYFEKNHIHLHVPAGATPKDGPSAGITMASALLSLATGKKLRPSLAMTGELSLTGSVLPIGGLKEKVIAAKRAGIKHIIIPKSNTKDLEEIPEYIQKGITFYRVENMQEVIEIIFSDSKDQRTKTAQEETK
ncbi:endopeptidase La [Spirochaetia bacterium 38H-sp]|uniref:Lon protease n=1 Tax=Rarispira pelagica TaxID=3141764 RepID=A0ABU9UES5_9SPIR